MTTLVTRAMLMDPSWDARAHILDTIAKSVGTNGHAVDFVPVCDPMQPLAEKTGVRVFGPDYLLAIFDRAGQKTSSNIYVPNGYIEDRVQGKVGLVIGIGPLCKGEEYLEWFGGHPPKLGDWVISSIREGISYLLGDQPVKSIEYKYIRMASGRPDIVQ